jgi:hypothetical protein
MIRLIRADELTPRAAARRLGATVDAVRYLLDEHPAPAASSARLASRSASKAMLMAQVRQHLTRDELTRLLHEQGLSHTKIAKLAREHGVPPRTTRRRGTSISTR